VYFNKYFVTHEVSRDNEIFSFLDSNVVSINIYNDQVFFEENKIIKTDSTPHTICTLYKNKWPNLLESINYNTIIHKEEEEEEEEEVNNFYKTERPFPSLESLGFIKSK
jgi:deoxyribodipyrimidine photolyase